MLSDPVKARPLCVVDAVIEVQSCILCWNGRNLILQDHPLRQKTLNFLKMNVIVNVKPATAGLLGGICLMPEQLLLQFG